ncbi:MAG: hypothetical protein LUP94_01950 [Candidatus Methanomethylicus sp.]|nr:hypothetical protein [Candidatus Methanomethylicus sp.]
MSPISRVVALGVFLLLLVVSSGAMALAFPSGLTYPPTFTYRNGDYYDSFGFDRNYYGGADGYFPNLAYETLGKNSELAFNLGAQFKAEYASDTQRAVAILKYVQRWTEYGYDSDNVLMNGVAQEEWAWNADETAHSFNETTGQVAIGDCEDMAFLCATLYIAAGYDVALVLTDEHVALLIWLPDYQNANYYWDINDGRGSGWIWVEATGEQNPLGWTPPDYKSGNWDAYPVNAVISNVDYSPSDPQQDEDVTVTATLAVGAPVASQVILKYSVNGGSFISVAMIKQGSQYVATIPRQSIGTEVKFLVSVTDTDGNTTESGTYSYQVGLSLAIPGFPFESIFIGLALGLAIIYLMARRRSQLKAVPIS